MSSGLNQVKLWSSNGMLGEMSQGTWLQPVKRWPFHSVGGILYLNGVQLCNLQACVTVWLELKKFNDVKYNGHALDDV